jgi:HK97 family phage prohead protease
VDVQFAQRTIDVIAVPFDRPTTVNDGAGAYTEVFDRSCRFETVDPQGPKVLINHDYGQPVGRVVALEATRDGLVAQLKIADGEDAALRRAAEGLYGVSIGFSAEAGTPGQLMRRRHAVVHEISLTAFGAYPGATVLAVRHQTRPPRPRLDEARAALARLRREGERT